MCVIIYAMTDEEGHELFPIHMLDDVTYFAQVLIVVDRPSMTSGGISLELNYTGGDEEMGHTVNVLQEWAIL